MVSELSPDPSTLSPLVVIVGPTASGKTSLAIEIAKRFNGEIICADSRTVYKGMDIGTAKPSKAEQADVPHHLLDIVEPSQNFSVADFQRLANQAITDTQSRGKLPVMVGGTGLYIDSVIFNYQFSLNKDAEKDEINPRHLKKTADTQRQAEILPNTLELGLNVPKDELEKRIRRRTEEMVAAGLEDEARLLSERFGWQVEAMTAVSYREWQAYFAGQQNLDETKQLIIRHCVQYAKRQRTWFKRNPFIQWVSTSGEAIKLVEQFLEKSDKS